MNHRLLSDYREGKQRFHVKEKRGEAMGLCASLSSEYLCCNVHVLATVSNCPFECSYCFLQNYLTDATLSVVGDTGALLDEVATKIDRQPRRLFRVGAWELGDSLALEPLAPTAAELVKGFAKFSNAILELKTKSDHVEGVLNLDHGDHTVISWTLNPESVIRNEEYGAADLKARLQAMKKTVSAGYPAAIHFDPMILYPQWLSGYRTLIHSIADTISPDRIAWISVGSLRFNPEMKKTIRSNYPGSRITQQEMITGDDGKMRYVKPLRLQMYRHLIHLLKQWFSGSGPLIYLCMERRDVWERVLGWSPDNADHLDFLFAETLYHRFPAIMPERPKLADYLS